ncbi:hypothetical protein Lesp02_04230 [Lentzea sp. NBRC 105346]|uniref:tyrosine-type recombinase/integrase n=1 Tax=Lentzea sp. NBRC 105346 TaxID=3032205 RepID=UPI0024A4B457|nr:site-specific integrase [Lentzea sp. NBRC 105346]GLZ28233.1 hypothetical protein Lesp02_04230 [Lentzea sp. NBRC 105346]
MEAQRPESADLAAARLVLARLGVSPEDLLAAPALRASAPTFDVYVPAVSEAVSDSTRRAYAPYWSRAIARWPARRIDDVIASEIAALVEYTKANAVKRKNGRGGRSAGEHMVAALRCLYKHAVADGYIDADKNPAAKVPKPRRLPSTRRGLADKRIEEIIGVASNTGDDPVLDCLLIRLHIETACRRGAALSLRPTDLDQEQCLILLREKGGVYRRQPVSPTLMTHLLDHATARGSLEPEGPLLRYKNGRPLTTRRYDGLWKRICDHLAWAGHEGGVSTHWLRHTTLTWVERNFGLAVAQAYAGHSSSSDSTTTTTYIRASLHEVATALAAMTGETHPLAVASAEGARTGCASDRRDTTTEFRREAGT